MDRYDNGYVLFMPIETKSYIEPWLSTQFAVSESLFMKETLEHKSITCTFVENIIKQFQLQSKASPNNSIKQLLFNTSLNISDKFMKDPMVLYIGLRKWVLIERLLENLSQDEYVIYSHMFKLMQDLVTSVESNKDTIKSLKFFNNWLEDEVNKKKCILYKEQSLSLSLKVSDELNLIIKITEDLQNRVIRFLILWQSNEIGVRKGLLKSNTFTLDIIQNWFEQLTDVLWNTREQVKTLISEFQENSINQELNQRVENLINQLIAHSFIVEEQPSLVLRTKTKLRVRCRLLIGKALIVDEFNPLLSCTITVLNEKQAEKLKSNNSTNAKPKGIVYNNVRSIEYIESTNKRVVSFQDIKLDKMERTTRTNTVNIADEKYTLVFTTNNLFKKGESKIKLLAVSLPFIAIVHGNQESQAWAAVLWDSLPIIPDSDLLNTPRVSWNDLAEQLSKKFKEVVKLPKKRSSIRSIIPTNEEKALTKENIIFLYYMALNHFGNEQMPSNMSITWDAIFRDKLPGRNFSFWDWFYSAMKLIQESLSTHWNNRIIFGFIDKTTAVSELRAYPPGTFILRFSGSKLGGLTVTYKTSDYQIKHICPYTVEDFKIHSFLNRMRDLNELKFIYPHGVRKCDVLGEHPIMSPSNDSDYVKTVLVTSICANINSSPKESTHDQYNIDHFPNSNGNYSNNLIVNEEQYNLNANYQQYNIYNTFRNSNNITSSIYDYNCSKSTTNYIPTASSFHDNKEFSPSEAHDSSTESFVVGNAITSSVNLLASDNYYYQICN